jgi:hypothetical protein
MSRATAIARGRAFHRRQIVSEQTAADLYRSPAAVAGKTGARTLTTEAIPIILRPTGKDDGNIRLIPLANPLNAARVGHIGKMAVTIDVRSGDELRIDDTRYLVEGVGAWSTMILVALSEIKGAA